MTKPLLLESSETRRARLAQEEIELLKAIGRMLVRMSEEAKKNGVAIFIAHRDDPLQRKDSIESRGGKSPFFPSSFWTAIQQKTHSMEVRPVNSRS